MASLLSDKKRQENLMLAQDALAEAKRKASTNWKRWKPDWEAAARYYRDAVKYFKLSGDHFATVDGHIQQVHMHKLDMLVPERSR